MNGFVIYGTEEYQKWFEGESAKSKFQVQARLSRISRDGHFGSIRSLKKQLWEIKFSDGRRIYYTVLLEKKILLLIGGNKNGQKKDIAKARKILAQAAKN